MIDKIKELEKLIKNGEWKADPVVSLWAGADVIIDLNVSPNTKQKIQASQRDSRGLCLISSQWAKEISALFYELKEIFSEEIDYVNKYYFYPRLAKRAKEYILEQDDLQVLLAILDEATLIAYEWLPAKGFRT